MALRPGCVWESPEGPCPRSIPLVCGRGQSQVFWVHFMHSKKTICVVNACASSLDTDDGIPYTFPYIFL